MNGEARDLRNLAMKIEQVCRESKAHSMAWEQVRAMCDWLTLRARVMELDAKCDDLTAAQATEKLLAAEDGA